MYFQAHHAAALLAALLVAGNAQALPQDVTKESTTAAVATAEEGADRATTTSPEVTKAGIANHSAISSNGTFAAPSLEYTPRAIGAQHGKAAPFEDRPIPSIDWLSTATTAAVLGAALGVAAVAFVAWRQAGIRDPKGTQRRCISVGMKLTAGFGGLTCLMLITSAITIHQQAGVIEANHAARELAGESDYLSRLADATVAMDDSVEQFLINGSGGAISSYNDAAATAKSLLAAVNQHVESPERRTLIASLSKDFDGLSQAADDVVAATDERDAHLAILHQAESRGQALVDAIAETSVADGELSGSVAVRELFSDFQTASAAISEYLRTGRSTSSATATAKIAEATADIQTLRQQIRNPDRVNLVAELGQLTDWWSQQTKQVITLAERRETIQSKTIQPLSAQIEKRCEEVLASIDSAEADEATMVASVLNQGMTLSGSSALIGVLVAAVGGTFIARSLIRPIQVITERAAAVASGDLTGHPLPVLGRSETAILVESINQMSESLRASISDVRQGSIEIDAGSKQIAETSSTLASGTSQQAASLQEISASLQELSARTEQNASDAKTATEAAQGARTSSARGNDEMKLLTEAMGEIQSSSSEISKIIKVIDEIAFQTNLLALNAAVEAARAGEAGKGFAVVAEEVRSLAQRSSEAAKSTSSLIESSVNRATRGAEVASRAASALTEITTGADRVGSLLERIAKAGLEQAEAISQINTGVTELNTVVQSAAASSEELASAAEETASQANAMRDSVARFKVSG